MLATYTWIWLLIGLVACSSNSNAGSKGASADKNQGNYIIEGTLTDFPNQLIKLQNLPIAKPGQQPNIDILDSTRTDKNGHFKITGSTPYKRITVLVLGDAQAISLVLDNINYSVTGDKADWASATITGSTETTILNNFLETAKEKMKAIQSTRQQYMGQQSEEAQDAENKSFDNFFGFVHGFIDTTSSKVIALFATDMLDPSLDYDYMKALYARYKQEMAGSPYLEHLQQKVTAQNSYMNQPAIDIRLPNPQGDTISLSDLRGKYVLLDFWASWCRPCRKENPNVVRLYNQYKDKGFTVFSVSLDRDKNSWINAIQQDGLIWPNHVSELKYWQSEVIKPYGINSIPATYLIDPDGNIIGKNLRGYTLEHKLAELFK